MHNEKIIDINDAPNKGMKLAYYRKKIVFEPYKWEDIENGIATDGEYGVLLELHLFDERNEFRAVRTESNEYLIKRIISDETEKKDSVLETMYLEQTYASNLETIEVVNYLDYVENGMIQISNYRLAMPGKQ